MFDGTVMNEKSTKEDSAAIYSWTSNIGIININDGSVINTVGEAIVCGSVGCGTTVIVSGGTVISAPSAAYTL